jgi:PPP family 3-phenylpropionic acid transporter
VGEPNRRIGDVQQLSAYKFSAFFQMAALSISTLFPLYWRECLGYGEDHIGYLNGIAGFIAISSPLFFGQLGGKRRLEKVIILCFLLSAAFSLGMLSYEHFFFQLLCLALLSFTRTGFTTLVPVGVLSLLSTNAGQGFGDYRRYGSIGFLVGVVGVAYLTEMASAIYVLWASAICLLIASLPYFRRIKIVLETGHLKPNYHQCFAEPSFKWLLGAAAIISTWWASSFIYLPLLMKNAGASSSMVGWGISICGIVAMLFLPQVGKWVDGRSSRRVMLMVPVFATLRVGLYSLPREEALWFIVIQFLHLPTWVVTEVTIMKMVKQLLPESLYSRGQALLQVSQTLGMAFGSMLIATLLGFGDLREVQQWFCLVPLLAYPFILRIKA